MEALVDWMLRNPDCVMGSPVGFMEGVGNVWRDPIRGERRRGGDGAERSDGGKRGNARGVLGF